MVLRQVKFGFGFKMALKASRGVSTRIYNKHAAAATGLDVLAARPVTGFATGLSAQRCCWGIDAGVRTGRKSSRDVRMAVITCLVAHIIGAGNLRRRKRFQIACSTGTKKENRGHQEPTRQEQTDYAFGFQLQIDVILEQHPCAGKQLQLMKQNRFTLLRATSKLFVPCSAASEELRKRRFWNACAGSPRAPGSVRAHVSVHGGLLTFRYNCSRP